MKQWYSINCELGHQGSGRGRETTNYAYANDAAEAFQIYLRMPGVKRGKTPNIQPLSKQEARNLEQRILVTINVSLNQAKKSGFFGTRL